MQGKRIRKIAIIGGGTSGWMAAALFSKTMGTVMYDVTLIESEEIGTVGVGEATIPPILLFNKLLDIDEDEFIWETNATVKLGIKFNDWRALGSSYFHPFGYMGQDMDGISFNHFWMRFAHLSGNFDYGRFNVETVAARENRYGRTPPHEAKDRFGLNYAFQFDASLYAAYLRRYAEKRGVRRVEGMVVKVDQDAESGFVTGVHLKDGQVVEGDFFIDCSGFRGLLIEQTLKSGYEDWSHWLPCDRAAAVPCEKPAGPIEPYVVCTSREAGWQWKIPLQHRTGNGYVFCSDFISEDEACEKLMTRLPAKALKDPKVMRFTTGHRRKVWEKNVVAVGLSSGFLEPLESTSIHLGQAVITKLINQFPKEGICQSAVDQFNADVLADYVNVKDFLIAHYKVTDREDTPFWKHCKYMDIPDSLKSRLEIFRKTGHVHLRPHELFLEASWFAVLVGQGLFPEHYHPLADTISEDNLKLRLAKIRTGITDRVNSLPDHAAFIERITSLQATG
jgi:tryptophan halogenase